MMLLRLLSGIVGVLCITLILSAPNAFALGQKSDICGSWNNYCRGGTSSGGTSSGGTSGGINQRQWQPQGPSATELKRRRQSNTANDLGVQCADRGDFNCAIRHYEEALRLYPSNATARKNLRKSKAMESNNIGLENYRHGNWDKAVQYFQKAFKLYGYDIIRQNLSNAKRAQLQQAREEAKRLQSEGTAQMNRELDELNTELLEMVDSAAAAQLQFKSPVNAPRSIKSYNDKIAVIDLSPRKVVLDKNKTALQQLQGMERSGTEATTATSTERASRTAELGFDTAGYQGHVADIQSHAIHETHLRIPKGLKPSFKVKSLARKWQKLEEKYQKYETQRQQLQKLLAGAHARRDNNTGKAPNLMQEFKWKEKLLKVEYNQKVTEKKQQEVQEKISFHIGIKKKKSESTNSGQRP